MTSISPSELARSLADVLNRAAYQGEVFEIERGGRRLVLRAEEPRQTRQGLAKALEAHRAKFSSDAGFGDDIMRARELADESVGDPWEP
ncbi:MAG: hypothetical protein JWN04_3466 [Myxococcaceae bacterium]|nr:hypothetical protein [Myxococcaceae bacterium]